MDDFFEDLLIRKFFEQFEFEPVIFNEDKIKKYNKFLFIGVGGSGLVADILKNLNKDIDIISHKDYGIPKIDFKDRTIIFNSYSGNTEEVIDAYKNLKKIKCSKIVISSNGKLLNLAKKDKIPYIQLLNLDLQPRFTILLQLIAILKIVDGKMIDVIKKSKEDIDVKKIKFLAKSLAKKINSLIPIFYSSFENSIISYLFKIKINESAKMPCFYNFFPELNHNEMLGFSKSRFLKNFCFIFLYDDEDNNRVKLRMNLTKKIYEKFGFKTFKIEVFGKNRILKILNSLIMSDLLSINLARILKENPQDLKLLEDFKDKLWKMQ
jgi:glucose/mannose-6-phosphate isomerase